MRSGHSIDTSSARGDRAVLAFAGIMILASLLLTWYLCTYWMLLTAFVGLNLLKAAITGFCPTAISAAFQ
jgi:hypothetical protein